jgi:hypothetical protein
MKAPANTHIIHSLLLFFLPILLLCSCSNKILPSGPQKYPPDQLREDYGLLRDVLEKFHPSLYWYTPKDSMDYFFNEYKKAITDSMTEQAFGFKILGPLTTKIRCGHTSFLFSKGYSRYLALRRLPSFPLHLKIWSDTMVVTANLNRKDSIFKRGAIIKSINGLSAKQLSDYLFEYLPTDGYSENINYIRLSGAFPYYHRNIMGLSREYKVAYLDSNFTERMVTLPAYYPAADTINSLTITRINRPGKRERKKIRLQNFRSLKIDSLNKLAVLEVNSFDDGGRLKKFFRKSFKKIKENNTPNLVIDIRSNGGGKVNNYAHLARYIRNTPFKVADTAAAVRKHFGGYGKYFQMRFLNSLALFFFARKQDDGRYHFRYWEKHSFRPKKKLLYGGNVYVLINGPTFSAGSLFAHTVKGQKNVTLVGEETGGGWHGNNGLMIPYITLPNTKLRVRMPLFRLVQHNAPPKDGRGVLPDIHVPPAYEAVKKGIDLKMEKVREMIMRGR